ncbi:MAG: bestrophin family protein [Bacteroidota bacterium]
MIYYKTNGNWFGDLGNLSRSWTMIKIMRSVLAMAIYSSIVCIVLEFIGWFEFVPINVSIFSLLGVILSILLVFRTNSAYDRWWEARKQWGALVNNTRNFAIYVQAMFPKENNDVRHFFAKNISNDWVASIEHLRDGTKLDKLIYLSDEDKAEYETKGHIPNHIALQLFDRLAEAHRKNEINEGDYINIKAQHQSLLDILGACERIKKTPIPFSYAVYLKIFIVAYGFILPFAMTEQFHLWTVPIASFVFFALIGVELLGEEIEDPFGLDCNDLPTGDIAHTIKNNVFEILEDRSSKGRERKLELYQKVF